jgi:hypothetical protein
MEKQTSHHLMTFYDHIAYKSCISCPWPSSVAVAVNYSRDVQDVRVPELLLKQWAIFKIVMI